MKGERSMAMSKGALAAPATLTEAPAVAAAPGAAGTPVTGEMPAAPGAAEVPVAAARVLLADDDARVRRFLARALRRHGYEVVEAGDGHRAVELAMAQPPDLAIVDLRMPGLDGFQVVRQLKALAATALPVLVLSGLDEADDRVAAFDMGADDFIPKPVHVSEMLKRIDAFERTRRAHIELRMANERADRLLLFAGEAAALLAHDLNNGLSIATSNLQYLSEELAPTGDAADALAASLRALRRMTGLVRNFVDISRLEDAALKPNRSPVDMHELLTTAAMIHDHRSRPEDRGIHVVCPVDLRSSIDPVLVERVIHNLLNNATRYVRQGGIITLRAFASTGDDGGPMLVIHVANTGARIPVDLRQHLFAKYRKGNDGKAQRGMGLYFCRLACEAHGGSIAIEDDPDHDTCFVIRLPVP
jgi:DNA-binding response OmpR family regulator